MKKLITILLVAVLLAGSVGCMNSEKKRQEHEEKQNEMLQYLQDRYDMEFTAVEFIPAKRGFNDFMNLTILVAKDPQGIVVNVRERVKDPNDFWDDYVDAYTSWLIENENDFSSVTYIEGVAHARIYVTLYTFEVDWKEILDKGVDALQQYEKSITCLIAMETTMSGSDMSELYNIYQQVSSIEDEHFCLIIGFSATSEKSKDYVNNFRVNGTQKWDVFDKEVSHVTRVWNTDFSYDEFVDYILSGGGTK
jgi:hypothetical protein